MLYNDGEECRVYRPVAGTLNILGEGNTPMGNFMHSHTVPHNPRPGKEIANVKEKDLDLVIDGGGKAPFKEEYHDTYKSNQRRMKVLERAKENSLSRGRPSRDIST